MTASTRGDRFAACLADELKGQLSYLGFTVSATARLTKEAQPTLSNWLNRKTRMPIAFVYSACRLMGVSLPDLFNLAEERMDTPTPMLMTGVLDRSEPTTLLPDELHERGDLFADCLAAELKAQLSAHNLSVWQIGQETGHSRTASGQWLNGQRVIPVAFAYSACEFVGISIADLVEQAERRMGEFVDEDEQWEGSVSSTASDGTLPPDIVGRRLRALLGLRRQNPESAYSLVASAVSRSGSWLEHETWDSVLNGRGDVDASTLLVIAEALGQSASFFTDPDPEVTDRIEAEATLAKAAAEAGVKRIAARGELTPEGLRKIAALVDKYVPKK